MDLSCSAEEEDQDWAICAIHVCVSDGGLLSVLVWLTSYVYVYAAFCVCANQEHMLSLAASWTWGCSVLQQPHIFDNV